MCVRNFRNFRRCARLAQEGLAQSASSKLAIKTLWRTVGRGGECAFLSVDNLRYDAYYQCAYITVAQTKVSKVSYFRDTHVLRTDMCVISNHRPDTHVTILDMRVSWAPCR